MRTFLTFGSWAQILVDGWKTNNYLISAEVDLRDLEECYLFV